MSHYELPLSLEAYEKACIERALRVTKHHAVRAAELLKVSRNTIYRRIRKYNITLPQPSPRLVDVPPDTTGPF